MPGPVRLPALSQTPPGAMTPRGRAILKKITQKVGASGKKLPEEEIQQECRDRGYRLKLYLHKGNNSHVTIARVMQGKIHEDASLANIVREADHDLCVIKVLLKNTHGYDREKLHKYALREMRAHSKLQGHPHVLPVYEFWCTEKYAYLVSELCEYADLANYVFQWKSWTGRGLPEPEARRVFRQLVSAVQYSHNSGFAHRDIKMENVFLDSKCNVRLADFGFAVQLSSERPESVCGSEDYMAPEIRYTSFLCYDAKMADIWSLGVLLHMLVVGHEPFDMDSMDLHRDIEEERLRFLEYGSDDYVALVSEMLRTNPGSRLTINETAEHTWLTQGECRRMYLPSVVPDRAEVADRTRHAVHRKPTKQPLYERGKCKGSARCSCCSREVLQESPREKVKARPNKEAARLVQVKVCPPPVPDTVRHGANHSRLVKKRLPVSNESHETKSHAKRVSVGSREKQYVKEKTLHVSPLSRQGYLRGCQIITAELPEWQCPPAKAKTRPVKPHEGNDYITKTFFRPDREYGENTKIYRKPCLKLNISSCQLEQRSYQDSNTPPEFIDRSQPGWSLSTLSKVRRPQHGHSKVAPPVFMGRLKTSAISKLHERPNTVLPPVVIPNCIACRLTSPVENTPEQ